MSKKDDHKATYYSGKKPYLTHNYRTMMKKKTQEEYYFHELHEDPMSEMLKPYWRDPELPGFGWEYMGPGWWEYPPFSYPGGGGFGAGGDTGPYDDDDGLPPTEHCTECVIAGPGSIECGNAWMGQVIPSQCAGFLTFALGLDGTSFETAVTGGGFIVVAVPDDTAETGMLVCSSGGIHGVTCCLEVGIECCADCVEFTLSGTGSIAAGANWVGTISPACPQLATDCSEVSVVSNSGCTGFGCSINEAGSELTISGTGGKCGQVTVTITYTPGGTCEQRVASDAFRITGAGDWVIQTTDGGGPACQEGGCGCGCGITQHAKCISEPLRYGANCRPFTFADCCYLGWSQQCKGANPPGCTDSNAGPPCGATVSCASAGCTCDGAPCNVGGGCCCSRHAFWICEWECEC